VLRECSEGPSRREGDILRGPATAAISARAFDDLALDTVLPGESVLTSEERDLLLCSGVDGVEVVRRAG